MCTRSVYYRRAQSFIKKFFREESPSIGSSVRRTIYFVPQPTAHARADFRFPIKSPSVYRLCTRIPRCRVHAPRFRVKSDSQCCCEKHPKACNNSFYRIAHCCTIAYAFWFNKGIHLAYANNCASSMCYLVNFRIYGVIISPGTGDIITPYISVTFQFPFASDELTRIYVLI